jgi:uroporphyrinogen-III synthase
MATPARVIITRPVAQAAPWVAALTAQGLQAEGFALIDIAPALSAQELAAVHQRAVHADVCMWVSSNAVEHFFQSNSPSVQVFTAQAATKLIVNRLQYRTRHWATGPGTVAALQGHGIPHELIDAPDASAQWDSQTLWQRVAGQVRAGTQVLIVRGQDVGTPNASRDWLAQQISAAGGVVDFAAVYQRRAPQFTAQQLAWVQVAAQDGSVWVFSSSQALTHLPQWPDIAGGWGQARCVVTHERIAQAAQARGFAVVCTSRPAIADVALSIKSIL